MQFMQSIMAKGSWSKGLIQSLNDPLNQIISTDLGVVIKDKYPKAMHHYLVLPKENIASIYHLKPCHLSLLSELHLLAVNIIEVKDCWKDDFKIGFHAKPSMERLHLHVISKDFVSPWLKTKKHWNSFNTNLFITYDELFNDLTNYGKVQKLDGAILKELEATELKCNQCDYKPKTMPNLKDHLLSHIADYTGNKQTTGYKL